MFTCRSLKNVVDKKSFHKHRANRQQIYGEGLLRQNVSPNNEIRIPNFSLYYLMLPAKICFYGNQQYVPDRLDVMREQKAILNKAKFYAEW